MFNSLRHIKKKSPRALVQIAPHFQTSLDCTKHCYKYSLNTLAIQERGQVRMSGIFLLICVLLVFPSSAVDHSPVSSTRRPPSGDEQLKEDMEEMKETLRHLQRSSQTQWVFTPLQEKILENFRFAACKKSVLLVNFRVVYRVKDRATTPNSQKKISPERFPCRALMHKITWASESHTLQLTWFV